MEHDVAEPGRARGERLLAVLVPEETGVRQARAQDPLVAGRDRLALVGALHVGDHQEAWREVAVLVGERQVFLVRAHRGGQHLGRQVHEPLLDPAQEHDRPFHQAGNLVEERRVVGQFELGPRGLLPGLLEDGRAPLGRVEDHLGLLELGLVIGKAGDPELPGLQEAVAARGVAEGQHRAVAELQRAREPAPVEDREHAVERTHPGKPVLAPAHRLGPAEHLNRLGDDAGQDLRARLPFDPLDREIEGALVGLAHLGGVDGRQAVALQEALDGPNRRIQPRALLLLDRVGLALGQAVDHERQAARRDEGARLAEGQPGARQALGDQTAKLLGRARLHARRNLLGQELEQQLRHVTWPPGRPAARAPAGSRSRPRSRPWRARAPGRCRPGARSRR